MNGQLANGKLASPTPADPSRRIIALDILRGAALLGILVMNIESFSGPESLHDIPLGTGHATFTGWHRELDIALLAIKWAMFEGKMRTAFAMLYGAGIVLLTRRFEERGEQRRGAWVFVRRNLWLLLFGLLHGTLIWGGDILTQYSITALLFMYPFRRMAARRLIVAGLVAGIVGGSVSVAVFLDLPHTLATQRETSDARAALLAHQPLSHQQRSALAASAAAETEQASDYQHSLRIARAPYLQQVGPRAVEYLQFVMGFFLSGGFLEIGGSMLLGMGLFKTGFLTGQLSASTYRRVAIAGYAISMAITLSGITLFVHGGATTEGATLYVYPFYEVEVFPGAIAGVSSLLWIIRRGFLPRITRALFDVGRTAFSNYILTSVLCRMIFEWGPWPLFGELTYLGQLPIVLLVWAANVAASMAWLRHYRYGPLEWVWRCLLYWRRQPLRRDTLAAGGERLAPSQARWG